MKSVKLYPKTALLLNKVKGTLQQLTPDHKVTDDKAINEALEFWLNTRSDNTGG